MFIVTYADGSIAVEGEKGINCWDDIPRDKKIAAVTLTAGGDMTKTLSGFDKYFVHYEAVVGMRTEVDVDGGVKSVPIDRPPEVICQRAFGFRRFGAIYHKFETVIGKVRSELEIDKPELSDVARKVMDKAAESIKKSVADNIRKMEEREIESIAISFSREFTSRSKTPLEPNAWREGVPDEIQIPSENEIRAILLK